MPSLLQVIVPKQEKDSIEIESEVTLVAEVICFYSSEISSCWVLNPKQLQFSTIGDDFLSIKLRKNANDNTLSLDVTYFLYDQNKVDREVDETLTVSSMSKVLDFPS
jgi:hypothetical protein